MRFQSPHQTQADVTHATFTVSPCCLLTPYSQCMVTAVRMMARRMAPVKESTTSHFLLCPADRDRKSTAEQHVDNSTVLIQVKVMAAEGKER